MLRCPCLVGPAIAVLSLSGLPVVARAAVGESEAGWGSLPADSPLVVEQVADLGFAAIGSLAFSRDGARLASSHLDEAIAWARPGDRRNDSGITLWSADTLEPVRELPGDRSGEEAVVFTPDGRLLSGGGDQTIRLWEPATGRELGRLGDEKRFIYSLAVSPSGRYLLAGGSDRLGNWLTRGLSLLWDLLARPAKPGYLQLWDLDTGARVRGFAGNRDSVVDVAVTPNERRVVAAAFFDQRVRAWEIESGVQIAEFALPGARDLAVLPDSRRLVAGGRGGTVLLDLESGGVIDGWPVGADHVGLLDGGRLAIGALPKRLVLRDLERRETLADLVFPAGEDRTMALAAAPDGDSFVIGTKSGRLVRLRLAGGRGVASGPAIAVEP